VIRAKETIVEVRGTFVHRIVHYGVIPEEHLMFLAKKEMWDIEEKFGIDTLNIETVEVVAS